MCKPLLNSGQSCKPPTRHTGRKRLRTDISYTATDTSELWCPSRKRNHSSYADREICHNDTTHRYTKEIQETKIRIANQTTYIPKSE